MADVGIEINECLKQVQKIAPGNNKTLSSEIEVFSENVEKAMVPTSKEWAGQVRKLLGEKNPLAIKVTPPRVARALLNVNREAYTPRFLSLGPYHHWKLSTDIDSSGMISTAEQYKVMYAGAIKQELLNYGKSFQSIVDRIKEMLCEIQMFYDWKIEDGENFCLMMAVDTSFLLRFLVESYRSGNHTSPTSSSSENGAINFGALQLLIKCDILKLENQLPLLVMKAVFEEVKKVLASEHPQYFKAVFEEVEEVLASDFYLVLVNTYMVLSPFVPVDIKGNYLFHPISIIHDNAFLQERHLLGCMHALVSPFLQMIDIQQDNIEQTTLSKKTRQLLSKIATAVCRIFFTLPIMMRGHRDFFDAYNTEQLAKAGIKFESFCTPWEGIRFDKYSETLYLPLIMLSNIQTEVFLRNMLAFEFNDTTRRCNAVTRYVALMHCLIQTPNDVRLLRDSDVIRPQNLMLTDEYVAKMWEDICQPFFTGHLDPPDGLKRALQDVLVQNYYKRKMRKVFSRFCFRPLFRAGKFATLLFGITGVVLTVIQTYCGIEDCASLLRGKLRL